MALLVNFSLTSLDFCAVSGKALKLNALNHKYEKYLHL